MKDFKLVVLSIILIIGLTNCQKELPPFEYVQWVKNPNNGIRKIKQIGNVTIDLQFKPIAFIIANENRSNKLRTSFFDKRKQELEGLQYYNLNIKIKGGDVTKYLVADKRAYEKRINYLSFGMKEDIVLIDGIDTLNCKLYHFERSFDLEEGRTFVLAFDQKESEEKTFIINTEILGTGPVKIKI